MKRLLTSLSFLMLLTFQVHAEERNYITRMADSTKLSSLVIHNQKWVPYPEYLNRTEWDILTGKYKNDIISVGEKYLDYEWKVIRMSDYLAYERTGSRLEMEGRYSSNNQAIASLFLAELAEGKGRFMQQIIDGVIHTCEMTSWAIAAHLNSLAPGHRAAPKENDTTLELTEGDVSQMLSWIYYFLHREFDKVDPEFSRRLRSEIIKREIDPYIKRTDFWWMGYNQGGLNNWNPWCNTNALITFMLMEDNPEKLVKGISKTIWSVDQYLNRIKDDGAIDEGPSYWTHSAGKAYEYLYALSLATGGKLPLASIDQVRKMGEYIVNSYVGDGWVVNFADASAKGGADDLSLIYRYGKFINSKEMIGYALLRAKSQQNHISPSTNIFGFLESLRLAREFETAEGNYDAPEYVWYNETQFHYARNDEGIFLATKGGYNSESHNHNDVGSFSLYANNTPVIIDVGVGTYTYKTFSPQRYELWYMQSNFHNIPIINGIPQHDGLDFRASDVKSTTSSFSANIAGAYPKEAAVRNWTRSYNLAGKELTITDRFDLTEAIKPNQVNFMTWGDIDIQTPGIVKISVNGQTATLRYDSRTFNAEKEEIILDDKQLSNIWGEKIYRIILRSTKLQAKGTYRYTISIGSK